MRLCKSTPSRPYVRFLYSNTGWENTYREGDIGRVLEWSSNPGNSTYLVEWPVGPGSTGPKFRKRFHPTWVNVCPDPYHLVFEGMQ